jgi:hypothetical protein
MRIWRLNTKNICDKSFAPHRGTFRRTRIRRYFLLQQSHLLSYFSYMCAGSTAYESHTAFCICSTDTAVVCTGFYVVLGNVREVASTFRSPDRSSDNGKGVRNACLSPDDFAEVHSFLKLKQKPFITEFKELSCNKLTKFLVTSQTQESALFHMNK